MLVDLIQGRPSERKRQPFEPDPAADLVILLRPSETSNAHLKPWEIAEVIRLRDFGNLSLVDKAITYRKLLADLIDKRVKIKGAKGYNFVNMDEAREIIDGKNNSPIAQVIRSQADFSGVSVIDVTFNDGSIEFTELTQIPT